MDVDTLIAMLEEIKAERGHGNDIILVPDGNGSGDYTPSNAYDIGDNVYIN